MKKLAAYALALLCAALLLAEISLRLSGVTDVPLYRPDPHYGYIPQANQRGAWKNKNRWVHNSLSMASYEEFKPGGILLVGDSIVSGGNQSDHAERLGPQITKLTGETVWPISAGSWSLLNELAWLRQNPEVVRNVDRFVFVLNDGDFIDPSIWRIDPDHPDHKPVSRVYYLIDRLILAPRRPVQAPPPSGRDWRSEFRAFRASTNKPVLVVLYSGRPDAPDKMERWAPDFAPEVLIAKDDPRWVAATFRDHLHPDAGGTSVLARLIDDRLKAHGPAPSGRRE